MPWYLVHTKPRQESIALQHLENQGYNCYLPTLRRERLRRGKSVVVVEPLFVRYLFIQLSDSLQGPAWGPVRSTRGVSRLVTFGTQPARVDDALVREIQHHERGHLDVVDPLFTPGDHVVITQGPFAGLEGIYQIGDGERRSLVLIELLSRPVAVPIGAAALHRTTAD